MHPIPDVVFHHHPCADGFAAALAVRMRYGRDIDFRPVNYNQTIEIQGLSGKNVYFVDFFPSLENLHRVCNTAKEVFILDHHKTAQETVAGLEKDWPDWAKNLRYIFDMDRSGAGLTWDFFHEKANGMPALIAHVQDRDLWRFKMPGSKEVSEYLFSLNYDFDEWAETLYDMETEKGYEKIIAQGAALHRKKMKDIREYAEKSLQWWWFDGPRSGREPKRQERCLQTAGTVSDAVDIGWVVPVLNIPYTHGSDAADVVLDMHPDRAFFAYYMDKQDHRQWGLRSRNDFDVSVVAKIRGGGGHKNASGFQEDAPQPGWSQHKNNGQKWVTGGK